MTEIINGNKNPDKKNLYIWIIVLLANIGAVLTAGLFSVNAGEPFFNPAVFIALGIFLFSSIVPILISTGYNSNKLKNRYGYGIPALLLLPIPYFIYDFYTCYSTFCEIGPAIYIMCLGSSAIIFALFYTIGIYAKKWNIKFVLFLILIEIIFLILLPSVYYSMSFCKNHDNPDSCYQNVTTLLNNYSICEKINQQKPRVSCYIDLANRKKDSNICLKAYSVRDRDECLSKVVLKEKDCEKIIDEHFKDSCYFNLADKNNNSIDCEKLADETNKSICYQDFALKNNDPEYCEKVIDEYFRITCYADLVKEYNNPAYCEKVIDDNLSKEQCYEIIESQKTNNEESEKLKSYDSLENEILLPKNWNDTTNISVNEGWKIFNDSENGFSIEYPSDFEIRINQVPIEYLAENTEYIKNSKNELVIDFSPNGYINPKNMPKEGLLAVKIYNINEYTIDQLIKQIWSDGHQRTEERENIKIGNIDALNVKISYFYVKSDGSLVPYTYKIVFIQGDKKIYALPHKDDYKYPNIYEAFYRSFKLL